MKISRITGIIGALFLVCVLAGSAFAMKEEFNYMSQQSLHQAVEAGADVAIVDIQAQEEFNAHHIKGAIKTTAYPVKSAEDKAKLIPAITELKKNNRNIVVICPRGKGGAERTVNSFVKQGVPSYRLFILTEGQDGWSYPVEKN